MKNKFKLLLTVLAVTLVLVACGGNKTTPATELATKLVEQDIKSLMMNTPDNFESGAMEKDTFQEAYEISATKWQEMLDGTEVPEQYKPQVEGQQKVAQMLAEGFKDGEITDVAYVGENKDGEISGLFIYYFTTEILIPDDRIEKANGITDATKAGEYFYVNGRYMIAFEQNFAKNKQEVFKLLDEAINGPTEGTEVI